MPVGYALTEEFARELAGMARRERGRPQDDRPRHRRAQADSNLAGLQWVKCTSGTADADGRYPATWESYDEASDAWASNAECYLRKDPNEVAPVADTRYKARCVGTHPGDGKPVYVPLPGSGTAASGTITVEDDDGNPSYSGVHTVRFDQDDGFTLSNPSAGVVQVDFAGAGTLTVEDDDANPSFANITTLRFDQDDGFSLSNPSAGVAQIDLAGGAGYTGTVTDVSNVVCSGSTLTVYFRDKTYQNGRLITVSAEY